MNEKEKIDDEKGNSEKISSNDNNKNIKDEKEKEKEKILENEDINNIINKDEDLNSSFVDESEDFKNSNKMQFRVILIGDSNVGKTSIVKKFITGSFTEKIQCTIEVEFKSKNLKIDKNLYAELKIFDTAGQEKYRAMAKSYYKNAQGILLIFSYDSKKSFDHMEKWLESFKDNVSDQEGIPLFLIGNKCDVENKEIKDDLIEDLKKRTNIQDYIKVSAKSNIGIDELFDSLAEKMFKQNKKYDDNKQFNELLITKKKKKKNSDACVSPDT